jgi:hypothetical protein
MDPSKPDGSVAPVGEEHHAVFSDEVRQEHHAIFGFGGTAWLEACAKECGHSDDDEDAVEAEPENPFLERELDKPEIVILDFLGMEEMEEVEKEELPENSEPVEVKNFESEALEMEEDEDLEKETTEEVVKRRQRWRNSQRILSW